MQIAVFETRIAARVVGDHQFGIVSHRLQDERHNLTLKANAGPICGHDLDRLVRFWRISESWQRHTRRCGAQGQCAGKLFDIHIRTPCCGNDFSYLAIRPYPFTYHPLST